MREILIEQMEKLNISKTERQILLEDFEVPEEIFEENFIEKHSKKPTKKDKLAFVKEYLKDHAMVEKPHERQSKKEEEQIDCILRALKRGKKRLNAEEMADLLRKEFHKAGTSVKTVYRRIIPDLLEHDVKKEPTINTTMTQQTAIFQSKAKRLRKMSFQVMTELKLLP